MLKQNCKWVLAIALSISLYGLCPASPLKPRIVVLTDVSTWETDDSESLVRLLVHADLFEIEGLIYTTGWSLETTREDFMGLIHDAISAYEKDLPNLRKRSKPTEEPRDESRQKIGDWPSPEYLRERTLFGSKNRGLAFLGATNDSPGSDLIIKLGDEKDDRPLWVTAWGGGNTLAQAIWRVQNTRSKEELRVFLRRLRVYAITDQDRSYKEGAAFNCSSHQWLRREFEKDLLFLWDEAAWKYQNGTGKKNWEDYAAHIQNHGKLGRIYPKYKYGVEGDTPSFLHLIPMRLNDPGVPRQAGWGGYFEWGKGPDRETFAYVNHIDPANRVSIKYAEYFYPAIFNNFVARMDWARDGKGNRNPTVVIDNHPGLDFITNKPPQGVTLTLDGSSSSDPDGDKITFKWWVLPEAGNYEHSITMFNSNSSRVTLVVPPDSAGKTFHLICEVADDGTPQLTGYRRVIFEPTGRPSATHGKSKE